MEINSNDLSIVIKPILPAALKYSSWVLFKEKHNMYKDFYIKMQHIQSLLRQSLEEAFWQDYYVNDIPVGIFVRYKNKEELEFRVVTDHKIFCELLQNFEEIDDLMHLNDIFMEVK